MRLLHPNMRASRGAPDNNWRPLVEAQAEQRSSVKKTRAELQTADGFTARSHDFPSANVLDAVNETCEVTLTNAPAGNHLYEAHYKVSIDPTIPGAGTSTHKVVVAIETDILGSGVWVEYWTAEYELVAKVGEPDRVVEWKSERLTARVVSLTSASKLRLKVKGATMPGGATFSVHGFNLATDGDLLAGVTYHTGPAFDFNENGGGVELADTVLSKLSHATHDQFETDLGGPPMVPDVAPYVVARTVWGSNDSADIAVDRFTAHLHPKQDAGVAKDVVWFVCQPYALARSGPGGSPNTGTTNELQASLVPLSYPVYVPAGDGTSAQDYVFSWADRDLRAPNGAIIASYRKPRPKSVRPDWILRDGSQNLSLFPQTEYDSSPTTFWFIWALKADGTPASNVGWARDSATTEVVNTTRKLRTVRIRRVLDKLWFVEAPTTLGATPRPVFRCKIECGSYAAADLEFTSANQLDLGAAPTETVEFVAVDAVPDGCASVFEVRNDADTAWLPFTDGQTAAEVGVSQREEYEVRWRATPNSQGDASPVLFEIGVRDVERVWLGDVADVRARYAINDVAELIASIPEYTITALRTGDADDFNDRITKLFAEHHSASLSFRIWIGDETRPRDEWHHKDDAVLVDDYEPRDGDIEVIAHSALVLLDGVLPVYNTTTEKREALVLANQTPKQLWDAIVGNHLAADIPARYRGEGILDQSVLLSKTITDSDGKTELDAIGHVAGVVLSTDRGKITAFDMFTPGSIRAWLPTEQLTWRATIPGQRQRVPEFFALYDYREESQKYEGETRVINGTALVNLKRRGLDAPSTLRDDVCRWLPNETIATAIAKRRTDTLGGGMLVWRFTSTEPYPEWRFGDLVAVETTRFVARDPTQTTLRQLKGAMWAIGRVIEYDLAGKEFGIWIQSWADFLGSSEVAALRGLAIPDLYELAPNVTQAGVATAVFKAARGQSLKFATSTSAEPNLATVLAASAQTLDSDGIFRSGTLATLTAGQTLFVAAVAFDGPGGTGRQSRLATARITHYEGGVTLDLVEKSRTDYTVTFFLTARDADGDTVKIHYRTVETDSPSESYASPAPTSEGSFSAQPHNFEVTVDRPIAASKDRYIEAWPEDVNGNKGPIQRGSIPMMTTAAMEAAITNFIVAASFSGSCPSQILRDSLAWTEAPGIPATWLAKLYVCSTLGCSPPTVGPFNSDGNPAGTLRTVLNGVRSGLTFTAARTYRVRLENSYGQVVDDDVSAQELTDYDNC